MFRVALVFILSVFLASCVTTIRSTVENYSDLPKEYQGSTVSVVAYPPNINESLSWKTKKGVIETELAKKGFRVVQHSGARYLAVVSYGIDGGTTTTETVSTPIYGQTGGGYTTHTGTVTSSYGSYGTFYGSSYTMPTYGIVGTDVSSYDVTTYKRALSVNIEDLEGGERVFEGSLSSKGTCGNISIIFPYLAEAMFEKFPDGTGRVDLTYDGNLNC